MKAPKFVYEAYNLGGEPEVEKYISVDHLKEWMYCNYGANDFMTQFEKFIEE